MAMASSAIEMRSPAVSSMSNSRPPGTGTICSARSISSSVVSPIADTTTTTSLPARLVATMRSATRLIRSASATDEPPYFCTTRLTRLPFERAGGASRIPADRPADYRRTQPTARRASDGGGESGVEDVEALVQQLVPDHQRRQEPQHVAVGAGGQCDQPLLVAGGGDGGGQRRVRGERAGLHQLNREHGAAP